jgi:hypothetical protein
MLRWLLKQLGAPEPENPVQDATARFAARLDRDVLDDVLLTLPEEAIGDAIAWLGEFVRMEHGGRWETDPDEGPHLVGVGSLPTRRFFPLAVLEKKQELRDRFAVMKFLNALDSRLEKESARAPLGVVLPAWGELRSQPPNEVALDAANRWRAAWKQHFGADLPFTLTGVREMDGFLRSQYLISILSADDKVAAGFFLGEVTRGLFGGEWSLSEASAAHEAALHFPEIDYYPIGKVFKVLAERPEDQQLDEYVRLLPSARSELRKQAAAVSAPVPPPIQD